MYKYKGVSIDKCKVDEIESEIVSTIENFEHDDIENLKELDYFLENISYIQKSKKDMLEALTYTKYKLREYLLSYQYGVESFSYNSNSVGIIYSILSLLNLKLYDQANFMFTKNEEKIIEIINSNKSKIDDFIDILIYFGIPITYVDDISEKLDNLKDSRKKYIYILINLINDRKSIILEKIKKADKELDYDEISEYQEYMSDIINIFRELNLHQLEELYRIKMSSYGEGINVFDMLPCDNLDEYIGKALLDIIDINKEDNNFIPKNITKYNYQDEFIKITSYQPNAQVSMHVLEINSEYIIIDCGASMTKQEIRKIDVDGFFKEYNIDTKKIKGVILSHAHLDHYGSIDLLQSYVDNIYMTKDTYHIIDIVAKDLTLNYNKVNIKKDNEKFSIGDINIEFFPANHIKGSIGACIEYKGKRIVYTGDFSFNRQSTTRYINENNFIKYKHADYLIIESTYGNRDIDLPYSYKKKLFNYFINLCVKNEVKIIIPTFAIGVAQECYDMINNSTIKAEILVDGLAVKVNEYYNKVGKKFSINEQLNYNIDKHIYDRYSDSDIIIATGGVMNEGSISEKYYKLAINDKKMVTILKCGYIDKDTIQKKIKPHDTININLMDISLASHAQYDDLIKTVNTIQPENLIMVHGGGIKLFNDINKEG
ncbi:MAG: MBL fold metallo-hydrolase [Peptostreptococcaceae bacterium]